MNSEFGTPLLEAPPPPSFAGRGGPAERSELRGDFGHALEAALVEDEQVETIFAIRGDRVAGARLPSVVLALTNRALLVLREPTRRMGAAFGVRTTILPLRALGGVEFGHSMLLGSLLVRLLGSRKTVPALTVYELRGGYLQIPYHSLDEQKLLAFVRRVREAANL